MPRQMPLEQAARVLGVHRRTVERRIKAGKIATTDVAGERWAVLADEVVTTNRDTLSRSVATISDMSRRCRELPH